MIKNLIIGCLALIFTVIANAATANSFSIKYADNSPLKDVPLKNATLHIKVYYNGNPRGTMNVKTNAKQAFSLKEFPDQSNVAIEVLSIVDQKKHNASCSNTPESGDKPEISIICKKVSKK